MANKRFDSSPKFIVHSDAVVIQQAAGSTAPLLQLKDHTGSALMTVNAFGEMSSASPTFTGTVSLPSTTSIGTVSSTEIGYLDGVTSAIQTQLNSKVSSVSAGTGISVSGTTTPTIANAGVTGLTGTSNQITVSASTGSVTLSLPQNIHTGASPTFAGITSTGNITVPTTSATYFGSANGSNFWRPIDQYGNSYFKIGTGWAYSDAARYVIRDASSVNIMEVFTNAYSSVVVTGGVKVQGGGCQFTLSERDTGDEWVMYAISDQFRVWNDGDKFKVAENGTAWVGNHLEITNFVYFDYLGINMDRSWENYPGIMVKNDQRLGPPWEFRVHGGPGPNGGDFGVNFRIDGSYLTASDRRIKTNITTISSALDKVNSLIGIRYQRQNRQLEPETHSSEANGFRFGLIAQDALTIVPEVVKSSDNPQILDNGWCDQYAIDYAQLTPLLIEAIKELTARVEELEAA